MEPGIIALFIPIVAFCIPITAILASHRQKLAEIKARSASGLAPEIRAELGEIKSQLADLRDTTTKFDMTFDAALDRLEQRIGRVEERQVSTAGISSSSPSEEPMLLGRRGGSGGVGA